MLDPAKVALFCPPGLSAFKKKLFDRIGADIKALGGLYVVNDHTILTRLPVEIIPVVGCMPQCTPMIAEWRRTGREFAYWDRGYCRRIFATDLPTGDNGGYYRWTRNAFQMKRIRDVPDDRWKALDTPLWPWAKDGRHIVVAEPSLTYQRFHNIDGWTAQTVDALKKLTDRPLVVRDKEMQRAGRLLRNDLKGAHCLVTHASNAATEAVIMGCPVFVDPSSAAALVGKTDLTEIETPIYPDREPWAYSLGYSQFNEAELIDGTLWRLIE